MAQTLATSHDSSNLPHLSDGLNESQRRILKVLAQKVGSGRQRTIRSDIVLKSLLGGPVPSLESALLGSIELRGANEPYLTTYLELARMAQTFRMRYPLVDWTGSFGTVDGDPPADCAFTRCGPSRFGLATLAGLTPNLLVNGAGGSEREGVYFMSHHLGEVLAAASALIREPTMSDDALVSLIPGPDFSTGGVLPSASAARQIYLTGEGTLSVRAKVVLRDVGSQLAVEVSEMPSWIHVDRLKAELSQGIHDGTLRSISGAVEQTDERGVARLLLPIGSGATAEAALAEVFARTGLETRIRVDMAALDDGAARRVSLPILLRSYVRQLANVLTARGEKKVTSERLLAELEALRVAHDDARRTQIGDDAGLR